MSIFTLTAWLDQLQALVTNRLDRPALLGRKLCAILGDAPSTHAKSPALWNAAFAALEAPATFVPLDVPPAALPHVVQLLRENQTFLGGAVTMPYKQALLPLLDSVDPLAKRIGAVNVMVRTVNGKLVGYNTDGIGGIAALTSNRLQSQMFASLANLRVLMIGAGGAAQAVAWYLWAALGDGELILANRTVKTSEGLAGRLTSFRPGRVRAVSEHEIGSWVDGLDLVINASIKGQAGIRTTADGHWTCFEPYSALAPAHPAELPPQPGKESAWMAAWLGASSADIRLNQAGSLDIMQRLAGEAICYDIIYAPLESTFLRHARWTGHRTLNGQPMNLLQAVEAFTRYVCADWLADLGFEPAESYHRVMTAMAGVWGR